MLRKSSQRRMRRATISPVALTVCRVPCRLWEMLSAPNGSVTKGTHLAMYIVLTGGRNHLSQGDGSGEVQPAPFLDFAPELASCLGAFLRCLPPVPQGCPCLRPGPGEPEAVPKIA